MLSLTHIINKFVFSHRRKELALYDSQPIELQDKQLRWLLKEARNTVFGKKYDFKGILERKDPALIRKCFAESVPVFNYDDIQPWICRMQKEPDILWPGRCRRFAKTSSTTGNTKKIIPLTRDAFKLNHMKGGIDSVVTYLTLNPSSRIFDRGKALILGFSPSGENDQNGNKVELISSYLTDGTPKPLKLMQLPKHTLSSFDHFSLTCESVVEEVAHKRVSSISGMVYWMAYILEGVGKANDGKTIDRIWPDLEVFFHGGISLVPYKEKFDKLIPPGKIHYLETYNASEGFFGIQSSWDDDLLRLVIDRKVYYEFIPMSSFSPSGRNTAVPLGEIELGVDYAMVVTTPGLWRFILGDVIRFEKRNPFKFRIVGRTNMMVNLFKDDFMVYHLDNAIAYACSQTEAEITDYTFAPCPEKGGRKAHYECVIEFSVMPSDIQEFTFDFDSRLKELNGTYEGHRQNDFFLVMPEIVSAPKGTFSKWQMDRGKVISAQTKVPRLSNSMQYVDELKAIIKAS